MLLQHARSAAIAAMLALCTATAGCSDDDPPQSPDAAPPDAALPDAAPPDAGPEGIAEGIFAPLGQPMPSATPEQLGTFERGREVSLHRFTPEDGLGPHFNVTFCNGCHEKPVPGGSAGRYRNFLLVGQTLPDDSFVLTGVNGIQPQYTLDESRRFPTPPEANLFGTRNPIPFFGVGLLAEIYEDAILAGADPDDADGDGISGRPNYQNGFIGRFGVKAQNAAIESFIRGPLFNHIGITSNPLPPARRALLPIILEPGAGAPRPAQVGAPDEPILDADDAADPELSEDELFDLVSFSMLLAAPQPDAPTAESEAGRALFAQANCTGCHLPALKGPRGLIPAYTDLLIHDMGPALADGVRMGVAGGAEFRTAPLWGVAAIGPYLHDGRADTLDEAIRLHAGEAQAARDAYAAMSTADQALVLAFLRSLGGASVASEGLLPPAAAVPAAGEYGGPEAALATAELDRFRRGRAIFDRDFAVARGLGPQFNGDACRACHFDPVIGGSGPADVNVMRHGIIDESGQFTAPSIGTMASRHGTSYGERAAIDESANFFEPRQTPALFGLGMVERIPPETILAQADPDDANGDGISGRAHILGDGRLGRMGWKANVPDLAEFARDGMSNELGVTVPAQPDLTFGAATDTDQVSDPEITSQELEDLTFYMRMLAPPPRTSTLPEEEDAGEILFAQIGCASCHTPALQDGAGNDVPLYSDLLLHDVALEAVFGIEEGDAGMRELRTPPLWGLGTTAPYLHDGSASTIEGAILQHATEAQTARDRYLLLPPREQRALVLFLESL
jgi:CxxC motif-containing protein (DUF1111 family)